MGRRLVRRAPAANASARCRRRALQLPQLAVSLDEVRSNFARYGLLDDQVRFLQGWFSDTLPTAPIDQLAVLRLDGEVRLHAPMRSSPSIQRFRQADS